MKYLLLIILSTLIFSCEDGNDVNIVDVPLSESQWEYVDLNGYWVFKDIYNDTDTVYVSSIMEVERSGDINTNTDYYTEWITLNIGESRLIQSGSNFKFITSGGGPGFDFGPIFLNDTWGLTEDGVLEMTLNGEIGEEDTMILKSYFDDFFRLNYTLVKSIGIINYEYIEGDSTYSSSLIDYQVERNYND